MIALQKEKRHLERITNQPIRQYADAKADAASPALVGQDLWQGERGFDSEGRVTERGRVERVCAEQGLEQEQGGSKVKEEGPVGAGGGPLPEGVGAGEGDGVGRFGFGGGEGEAGGWGGPVHQRDVQEQGLDEDHEHGLQEERDVVAGA